MEYSMTLSPQMEHFIVAFLSGDTDTLQEADNFLDTGFWKGLSSDDYSILLLNDEQHTNNCTVESSDVDSSETSVIPVTVAELANKSDVVNDKKSNTESKHRSVKIVLQPKQKLNSLAYKQETSGKELARRDSPARPSIPEFLLQLLSDPVKHHTVVRWENTKTGVFRINNGYELSKLWNLSRDKPTKGPKYDFFARAMRYHYKQGDLKKVTGRKLLYQIRDRSKYTKFIPVK